MLQTLTKWMINDMVAFTETRHMGMGLIAIKPIAADTEILRDPVRSFNGPDCDLIRKSSAYPLFFVDREAYTAEGSLPPLHLVVGPITMINHNKDANCAVSFAIYGEDNPHAKLVAKRPISEGDQIFITYHNIDEYDFA